MSNTQSMSMNILLQKLNEMSEDSRRAREQMASEAKADREELRRSIQAIQAPAASASSAVQQEVSQRQTPEAAAANVEHGSTGGHSTSTRQVRRDTWSTSMANDALARNGCVAEEQYSKKLRSGYNMTINDQVQI